MESEEQRLSKTHNPYRRGDSVHWIPKKYASYEEFQVEHQRTYPTQLLLERLKCLSMFRELFEQPEFPMNEYLYHRNTLTRNYISLRHNIDSDLFSTIFGPEYDDDNITPRHILNIISLLEGRLTDEDNNRDKILSHLVDARAWCETVKSSFVMGPDSFIFVEGG